MGKYAVSGAQGLCQAGSGGTVLANKLSITDPLERDDAELELLHQLYFKVLGNSVPDHAISVRDLKKWHRMWLSPLYEWAGEERTVNMAKADFSFAAALQIPKLLDLLEKDYLRRWTPCTNLSDDELIKAIATIHVEFILIHPFREGNGRLSRLLADVMASQAGYGTLDYSGWDQNKDQYFAAIRDGLDGDYSSMMKWVGMAFNG